MYKGVLIKLNVYVYCCRCTQTRVRAGQTTEQQQHWLVMVVASAAHRQNGKDASPSTVCGDVNFRRRRPARRAVPEYACTSTTTLCIHVRRSDITMHNEYTNIRRYEHAPHAYTLASAPYLSGVGSACMYRYMYIMSSLLLARMSAEM